MFSNGGQGVMSESIQKHPNEVDSVTKYDSLSSYRNSKTHSNGYLKKHVTEEPLLLSSDKSILPTARDADAWLAPGNIVWVKDTSHGWWPAEVTDIGVLKDNDYQHTARVLVQLFKIHRRVWADSSDLSQFSNCFEERSQNPSEAFQDALKQALSKYGNDRLRTSESRSAGEIRSPTQQDKSPDASKTSISSSSKDDHDEEGGRGKRKKKTKIHFDEMAVADNPARKIRRLKIMRLLGLAAPVGSPFSPTHKSS
ncbi:uncharacterized protein LOC110111126 [Dendrobium catenatum]|uniref:uncharacterized protein LOC110111126 n=1 Tax=Dendrobium catenatum TaxID=906689 RepID=UPI0009F21CA7|nr:uncharacterized protein LOC110111126 [Dendrobium catenatum]XP_020698524.1 uncharacterized protein LOC110111126 [Dendrobium catenatum]XP_020698525.1 uncharacterized protein LOC110111126 [Dendrobium catenatum]XP_028555839.1 uncharacterized protein LOC110111126 [Dendrobium catenatum]